MQAQNLLEQEEYEFLHANINRMLEVLNAAVGHPRHARLVANRADVLINAYEDITRRVGISLRIQNGDVTRLRAQLDEVCAFAADAERVRENHLLYNVETV